MEKEMHAEANSEPKTKKRESLAHDDTTEVPSLGEIAAKVKKWSRANPIEAAVIGVGLGFVVGVLLRKTFSRSE